MLQPPAPGSETFQPAELGEGNAGRLSTPGPGYFRNSNQNGLRHPGSINTLHPWGSPPGKPALVAIHLTTTPNLSWAAPCVW